MTKKSQPAGRQGFTLIELLIYMALVVIFIGILTDLFVSTLDLKKESEAISVVEQDGRFILSRLIYEANQNGAQNIITNYTLVGADLVLNGEKLNSSETEIYDLQFLPLANTGGKVSVQSKFKIRSMTERSNGPEIREYQITLGSR